MGPPVCREAAVAATDRLFALMDVARSGVCADGASRPMGAARQGAAARPALRAGCPALLGPGRWLRNSPAGPLREPSSSDSPRHRRAARAGTCPALRFSASPMRPAGPHPSVGGCLVAREDSRRRWRRHGVCRRRPVGDAEQRSGTGGSPAPQAADRREGSMHRPRPAARAEPSQPRPWREQRRGEAQRSRPAEKRPDRAAGAAAADPVAARHGPPRGPIPADADRKTEP